LYFFKALSMLSPSFTGTMIILFSRFKLVMTIINLGVQK
jgi:hypothetical protein